MSITITPALIKAVRNRTLVFNSGLAVSLLFGVIAIIFRNGSHITAIMGIFGILGTMIFFLLAGSENESYRRAKSGEPPYGD